MFKKNEVKSPSEVRSLLQEVEKGNHSVEASFADLKFKIANEGELTVEFKNGMKAKTCPNADEAICKELGIPYSYFTKISDELKLQNLRNRAQALGRVRSFQLNDPTGLLRGVKPISYMDIPNSEVFQYIDESLGILPMKSKIKESLLRTNELTWRVILQDKLEVDEKSVNHVGVSMTQSELGGFFHVEPMLYRVACANGLLLISPSKLGVKISYENIQNSLMEGLMKTYTSTLKPASNRMAEALKASMETEYDSEKVVNFFEKLKDKKISGGFINELTETIPSVPITEWDLLNHVTSKAHELKSRSRLMVEAAVAEISGLARIFAN